MENNNLVKYIHGFLEGYIDLQKGFSRHTILSYRDTIKLLLKFTATDKKKSVTDLTLSDLSPSMVMRFLEYLEKERGNSRQTRNNRLACIHSLFHYIANFDPLTFAHCQRVLAIPLKRTSVSTADYLEREEVKAILEAVDRTTVDGYRDYVILSFIYETGARVQEVITLPARALQLEQPFQVRFLGKGEKERICPLWPDTAKLLRSFLSLRGINPKTDVLVFSNHRGRQLTRQGVRYLLTKYVGLAAKNCSSLNEKRIHPHTLRHSCAMHLLESGIDINTIRAWLGHARLDTTNRYAQINLEMKRKVLEKHLPLAKSKRPWKGNERLLQWLESR
jgi:site-specific recombinase XerD